MTNVCCFTVLFLIASFCAFSQASLKGKVISEETQKPLAAVSVYINNTSLGSITTEDGQFTITGIPFGRCKLVASCVGFETYVSIIDPRTLRKDFIITLKPKAEELQSFSVTPPDPDGWKKWGKLFIDLFIGTNSNSNQCHIENPEVIRLRMNPDNTLSGFAKEPLIILNYALGYEIKYKLEEFEYDFNTKVVIYNGYALFKDLGISGKNKPDKYTQDRKETFQGSLMHFMRSYFVNRLSDQGFEMRNLGKIVNPEKERAKNRFRMEWSLYRDSTIKDTAVKEFSFEPTCPSCPPVLTQKTRIVDSTDYFKKKLLEPDSIISRELVLADSIGFAEDSATAGMYYKDSLEVSYKLKTIPNKYKVLSKEHKKETYPVSQFVFINRKPIYISANGYYYGPYDLKITGFWAWWEIMSTMLPYDYSPGKN